MEPTRSSGATPDSRTSYRPSHTLTVHWRTFWYPGVRAASRLSIADARFRLRHPGLEPNRRPGGDYRVIAFHRGHGQRCPSGAYSLNRARPTPIRLDATLAARACGESLRALDGRHCHCRLVGPTATKFFAARTPCADQHHRRPGAQGETAVGATRVVQFGCYWPKTWSTRSAGSTPRRGQGLKPARDLHAGGRHNADPSATRLVYELFTQTSAAGRGGTARMLVEEVGSAHLNLDGLTVPALVIGGVRELRSQPVPQDCAHRANIVGLVGELCRRPLLMLEQRKGEQPHLRAWPNR